MAVPQNKSELLDAINKTYARLSADLRALPTDRTGERTLEGHVKDTLMSVHDLAAYLLGWNELVLKWCHAKASGLIVDFPETGYKWNELGRLAQKFYADYAALPYPELLDRLDAAKADIVALVENNSNEALYGGPWYEQWTLGRMIQFNTASPYTNARARLRNWLKHTASS